jgi:hypothetical protein
MTVEEIIKTLKKNQWFAFDKESNIGMVMESPALESPDTDDKMVRVFQFDGDNIRELDVEQMTSFIVDAVKDKISIVDLLKEVLKTTGATTLIQAYDRLQNPKVKEAVGTRHGCFAITIPSDTGEELLELVVRS